MAWNDQRPLLAGYDRHGWNGRVHQLLQRSNFALDASALRDIDYRETPGIKNITRHNNIGPPKKHNRIAICVRSRLMEDFNTLAVELHVFPRLIKRFRWSRANRKWRELPAGSAHSSQDLFDGKDGRSPRKSAPCVNKVCPALREGSVAAQMIGISAGVDHVTDGLYRDFLDGRDDGIRVRRGS